MIRFTFLVLATLAVSTFLSAEEIHHRLLTADASKGRIAILAEDGTIEWEHKIRDLHDLHLLDNGNVLFQDTWTHVLEVNPKTNETVWEYDSASQGGNQGKRIEVHAFQRLSDGTTMIVESGATRIIEVSSTGEIVRTIALKVSQPHPHRDTRLVRKLPTGNYLVCHEGDGRVCEYDVMGKIVWEYTVPLFDRQPAQGHGVEAYGNQCFSALRLKDGSTVIATGNGHGVIKVSKSGELIWRIAQNDLPGIQLAWVTTLQELPNGNLVVGNCHAEKANPQIIELDQDHRVVWKFHDFERFGNALTNTQILSTNGTEVPGIAGVNR